MALAYVYCVRHGAYEEASGSLTPFGKLQMARVAKAHLSNITFDAVLHSGAKRADESTTAILRAASHPARVVRAAGAFNFDWLEAAHLPQLAWPDDEEFKVASDYLNSWPPAWALMGRAGEALRSCAIQAAQLRTYKPPMNTLVVSHSPIIELAATKVTQNVPLLDCGDIIRFNFKIGQGALGPEAELIDTQLFACPPIE